MVSARYQTARLRLKFVIFKSNYDKLRCLMVSRLEYRVEKCMKLYRLNRAAGVGVQHILNIISNANNCLTPSGI